MPRGLKVDRSQKRKAGRKGNFNGKRLQLLESYLPHWDKARLNRTTGDFWITVFSAYWAKFPWHLQQNEEPPDDAPLAPTNEELTEEELERKVATIRLVEKVRFLFFFFHIIISKEKLLTPIFLPFSANSKLFQ